MSITIGREHFISIKEQIFKSSKVISVHKNKDFKKIPKKKLMDFALGIRPRSHIDMSILETWKAHFRSVGTPYSITKTTGRQGEVLTLWKERRI